MVPQPMERGFQWNVVFDMKCQHFEGKPIQVDSSPRSALRRRLLCKQRRWRRASILIQRRFLVFHLLEKPKSSDLGIEYSYWNLRILILSTFQIHFILASILGTFFIWGERWMPLSPRHLSYDSSWTKNQPLRSWMKIGPNDLSIIPTIHPPWN